MIYEYECNSCSFTTDIIKHHSVYDREERCSVCSSTMQQIFTIAPKSNRMERAEYNHALGCVVKSNRHKQSILKEKGLVEVGTESLDKMHKFAETRQEEKFKKSWDEV